MEIPGGDALRVRMAALLLRDPPARPTTVAGVVEWFGAMQAQDHGSGLWSLGCRLPGTTRADIEAAVENREALRTWPMRGTVHLVPPRDARWMLELTGSLALAGAATRRETLGLPTETADRAVEVLGEALAGGGRLTRAECVATFEAAGIRAQGNWAYHLLWYASQKGVTCIGPHQGSEQTFVLLDEWVPDPARPTRDEALALLASRYFRSHGPTTRKDFQGWTGLNAKDAKQAIALAGDTLTTVRVDGAECWADAAVLDTVLSRPATTGVHDALSGFDEYLLGYKDRALMIDKEGLAAVIPGGNGVFRWTIVRDGRTIATWQRTPTTKKIKVTVTALGPLTAREKKAAEAALTPYESYAGLPLDVTWS